MEIPYINRAVPKMDQLYLEDIEIPYLREMQRVARFLAELERVKAIRNDPPQPQGVKFWGKVVAWFTSYGREEGLCLK